MVTLFTQSLNLRCVLEWWELVVTELNIVC